MIIINYNNSNNNNNIKLTMKTFIIIIIKWIILFKYDNIMKVFKIFIMRKVIIN